MLISFMKIPENSVQDKGSYGPNHAWSFFKKAKRTALSKLQLNSFQTLLNSNERLFIPRFVTRQLFTSRLLTPQFNEYSPSYFLLFYQGPNTTLLKLILYWSLLMRGQGPKEICKISPPPSSIHKFRPVIDKNLHMNCSKKTFKEK